MVPVTILSVPGSGTRFLLYMIGEVMELPVTYVHLTPRWEADLKSLSGTIVMPRRTDENTREVHPSCAVYVPADALVIDVIPKRPQRFLQVDRLVTATGSVWTPALADYVCRWQRVGSHLDHEKGDPVSDFVIAKYRREPHAS